MSMVDSFARSLLSGIGITPEQARETVQLIWAEITSLRQEKSLFKQGASDMVAHFNRRLDRIEAQQADILQRLALITYSPDPEILEQVKQ